MCVILLGLTDWFSPIQGETGPSGPTGASGARGAPVSSSLCRVHSVQFTPKLISWCVSGTELMLEITKPLLNYKSTS